MKQMIVMFCVLGLSAGCDTDGGGPDDPAPYDGTLSGVFDGQTFVPVFGVGAPREPVGNFTYELQFSDSVPLSCESRLRAGGNNELGLYIRAQFASSEPGTYEAFIEYAELTSSGTRQRGASGMVTIATATAEQLTGSIVFEDDTDDVGTITLDGGFEVVNCPD